MGLGSIIGNSSYLGQNKVNRNKGISDAIINFSNNRKQKEKENLIDEDDFVVVDKSLKKPYANGMMNVNKEMVERMVTYQNDGKGNAKNRFLKDYTSDFLPNIQSLRVGNAEASKYYDLVKSGKIKGYDSIVNAIVTGNSIDELNAEVSRLGDKKIMSDDMGNFSFIGVSPYDFSSFQKIEPNDYMPEVMGTPRDIGKGIGQVISTSELSPQVYESKKHSLMNDPAYINEVYHDAPLDIRNDAQKFKDYLMEDVNKRAGSLQTKISRSYSINLPKTGAQSGLTINNNTGESGKYKYSYIPVASSGAAKQDYEGIFKKEYDKYVDQHEAISKGRSNKWKIENPAKTFDAFKKGLKPIQGYEQITFSINDIPENKVYEFEGKEKQEVSGIPLRIERKARTKDKWELVVRTIETQKNADGEDKEVDVDKKIPFDGQNKERVFQHFDDFRKYYDLVEKAQGNQADPPKIDPSQVKYRKKMPDGRIALGDANGKLLGYE